MPPFFDGGFFAEIFAEVYAKISYLYANIL